MSNDPDKVDRDEIEAMLGVRQEMGEEITPALVDSMAERIELAVQQRTADVRGDLERRASAPSQQVSPSSRVAVAVVSLVMAIPLTAIAADLTGLIGTLIVWIGIVGVNFMLGHNSGPRRDERR